MHDLQSFQGRTTHTVVRIWYNSSTSRVYSTFQDLQNGFDTDEAAIFTLRSRGYNGTRLGGNYVDIDWQNTSSFPALPSNDPTGISLYGPEPIPTAFYEIDIFNYLDPARTFNMYWGLTGPAIPGAPVTSSRLVDLTQDFYGPGQPYYKNPGSKFVFKVDNYYNNYNFNNNPPDPTFWSLYNASNYHDYNNLIFGIVDAAKTCGETVAYISLLDETGIDPAYLASEFEDFTSDSTPYPLGPIGDCFALMMETLNQYNPTSFIINWRGNDGGLESYIVTLASFFGDNRSGKKFRESFADNGNRPGISFQDIQNQAQFLNLQSSIDAKAVIDTDLFVSKYPNSIVRTEGTKVFFLTDTNAASSGDICPHYFRNNDAVNPGDIGFGVTSYIVGDIDGRVFGSSSLYMNLFTNVSHNLYQNGEPVSAFRLRLDDIVAFQRTGVNDYVFTNQNPVIQPDLLFNMDIENTFWLDVGSTGTYPLNPVDGGTDPLVLPLSTGVTQPVYANQTTWRDRSLEACLMLAIPQGCFSVSKAKVKKDAKHSPTPKNTKKKIERMETSHSK
jgi:hypothetical protein